MAGPQKVTIEDSMCNVQASQGRNPPASEFLKSEPAIVAGIARATLRSSRVNWAHMVANYDDIRQAIEAVFPIFENFNERILQPGGFHLTSNARQRIWDTPTAKANFLVFPGLEDDLPLDQADALWLTTVRSHDQYNTTIYGLDDRYRGVYGQRRVLFLGAAEMLSRQLAADDLVDLRTLSTDGVERVARGFKVVRYDIPAGMCAAYYPETNGLAPLYSRDARSGTPATKAIPIQVFRSEAGPPAP
jgi:anaerobic selenocysteine-containing dehydrogenase